MRKTSTPYARMPVHGLVRRAEGIGAFFATLVQFRYPKGGWNSSPKQRKRAGRSYRSRSAAPKCRRQIFQSSPRIQEERLGFIDEIGRSGVDLAVRIISPSVAACLLSACAAQPVQPVWMKKGASESDFDQDRRACTLELRQRPLRATNQALYDACMGARGWKQTAQAATQPPRNSPSAF
jgi:hypothetical protein